MALGRFKEVRGSFAILFWLPCATWHSVMTHTHLTHFDRPTLFFATRRQGRSEGFLLHASGLSFGFQARCTASSCGRHATPTNSKRHRFQKRSVVEWCLKARNGSGGSVDDVDRSTSRWAGAWSIFWTSSQLFSSVVNAVFPCLRWWTWGMSSRSFTTEEMDSSPRLLLEQTTSTPWCRSGECSHNWRLVSLSLAVLYFNVHFRCLPLMH